LLIFSLAKIQSVVQCIKNVLDKLASPSSLNPNPSKSTFYCPGIAEGLKGQIKECLQMREEFLPVRHLSVPFISKKLLVEDCEVLLQKTSGERVFLVV
jgi:hypothetical protein